MIVAIFNLPNVIQIKLHLSAPLDCCNFGWPILYTIYNGQLVCNANTTKPKYGALVVFVLFRVYGNSEVQ